MCLIFCLWLYGGTILLDSDQKRERIYLIVIPKKVDFKSVCHQNNKDLSWALLTGKPNFNPQSNLLHHPV